MTDPVFAKNIDDILLSRFNDKSKIIFILELKKEFKDIEADITKRCANLCSSIIDRANHIHSLHQRLHILRLLFTVTRPYLYNEIYFPGLSYGYSYESICAAWYRTEMKEPSEDYYVTNKKVHSESLIILYVIGRVINKNTGCRILTMTKKNQLSELYNAFTSDRQMTEVLFETVNSME